MPSYFESLSMVALEAWGMGKPVLANGKCDVLRGQAMRSNAGLYYESYAEFVEAVRVLDGSASVAAALGRNGRALLPGQLRLADHRAEVPRHVRPAVARAGGGSRQPGDGAAARLVATPPDDRCLRRARC